MSVDDYPWEGLPACQDENTELWFSLDPAEKLAAKTICRQCPITDDCLEYSIEKRIYYGIWGGLDEIERDKIIRKRNRRLSA